MINPPQPNSLDDKLDPPLGLMYIAAVLREKGLEVKIVDLCFVEHKDWPEAIGVADIYGITVFSSSLYLAREIAAIAKENNPNGRVVAGGPHPTALPLETKEFFDSVAIGEGEYALLQPVAELIKCPVIENLDDLPLPARDLVDLTRYTRKVYGEKATTLITSRGCPYSCAFCCKDVFGHRVRYRSTESVLREIRGIVETYDIRNFLFYDDTFALDRKRFYPLCRELEKENIIFRCNGDVRNNTEEDFRVLYDAGCREIAFGIESGSQAILDNIHKGTTVKGNRQAIQNAKKIGLRVKAFLMVGNPGESKATIEETKRFITEADPDQYTVFNFVPLPGCDIWKNPEKYGVRIVNRNFKNYFNIAGQNEGGLVIETDSFNCEEMAALRKNLLDFLTSRGQRGQIQDYYENSSHN